MAVVDSLTLTGRVDQSLSTAGLQRLRDGLCRCLGQRRDVLELVDALLAAEAMPSLPHLVLRVAAQRTDGGDVGVGIGGDAGQRVVEQLRVAGEESQRNGHGGEEGDQLQQPYGGRVLLAEPL